MPRPPSKKFLARKARVDALLPILKKTYPNARCSLEFASPLELIVATILSAQCTDERVNLVTKRLFRKYRMPSDYVAAPAEELEKDIQSAGFFRNKAKSLRGMAQALIEKHEGQVPRTMEDLTALPGVGRKTANVVLGNAFGINIGIAVDTHVTRVANRLGLVDHESDAVKIEHDLIPLVPREDWALWSHLLIQHGREICDARKPECERCPIFRHCPAGPKFLADRARKAAKKVR
jgi:endonuclease-3